MRRQPGGVEPPPFPTAIIVRLTVTVPENLLQFRRAVEQDPGRIELADNRPQVGYFCPLVPLEMIHAAGYNPVRIFRFDNAVTKAESQLPSYCCHLVRGGLEAGLSGRLAGLHGLVFGHTCDSMQNVADIWPRAVSMPHNAVVRLPTRADSASARDYLVVALARFRDELGAWSGLPLTNYHLQESLELYAELRRHLRRLYQLNAEHPGALPAEEFLLASLAAFRLPPDVWLNLIQPVLAFLETAEPDTGRIPLFLAGNLGDDPDFYRMLDEANAAVADDDLCTGRRAFDFETPDRRDPLEAMAEAFMHRPLCPCKHTGLDPAELLLDKVRRSGAKGVVFLIQKYCEPHFFEYPEQANALKNAGLPHLLLETSRPGQSIQQVRIRLEAFLEMLE